MPTLTINLAHLLVIFVLCARWVPSTATPRGGIKAVQASSGLDAFAITYIPKKLYPASNTIAITAQYLEIAGHGD